MTRAEAIEQMKLGKKITHRNFSPNEWMTIENGLILLEDGVKCSTFEFWHWRTDASWYDDFEFFEK